MIKWLMKIIEQRRIDRENHEKAMGSMAFTQNFNPRYLKKGLGIFAIGTRRWRH